MKNKMELQQKTKTKIKLRNVIVYAILGGSILSVLIYLSTTLFGVIGNSENAMAAQVTGYSWEATINTDFTKVQGVTDFTNFPILVSITNTNLKSIANGGRVQNSAGFDIVFSDMNNNQIDHQIESYNPVSGKYVAWINLPVLKATTSTTFKMFYGNPSITSNTSSELMWSNNYEGVWHMSNDPATTDLDDGAGSFDGVDFGGMNGNDLVNGKIGGAIDFDGTNDYYAIKDKFYTGAGCIPTLTVSGWFKTTFNNPNWSSNWAILDFDRSEYFNVFVHGNGKVGFSTRGSGNGSGINDFYVGAVGQYNDGKWHHVVAVYDGTNKYIYMDGVLAGTKLNAHNGQHLGKGNLTRYGFIGDGSEAATFNGPKNNRYYQGKLDEIRFLNTPLSADWIATEYANQDEPDEFATFEFSSTPLPIKLTSFNAELVNDYVELTWTTASEINNDFFTIEKSADAKNYEYVGEVAGAGNSSNILHYNYTDYDVSDGVVYYRLKQTDFDGKFEYFPPKMVNSSSTTNGLTIKKIMPNPFRNKFVMEIESENEGIANVIIYNMNGIQVHNSQIEIQGSNTEFVFNKGNQLPPGTYIVHLIQDNKEPIVTKIVKE